MTVTRFEPKAKNFGKKKVRFPDYDDSRLSAINESWHHPSDTITLPENFFDFTEKDNSNNGKIV